MSDSTRGLVRLLVALFYAGGTVVLLLLLAKGNADALAVRTGVTALSAVVLGLVATAGARLFEHEEPVALWGVATIAIAIVSFVAIMAEVWPEHVPHHETRLVVMVAISLLLGGGSLTLSDERPGERQEVRIARSIALLALVALGVFTVLVASDAHVGPRWFGIAATVFLISALSPPLLRLVSSEY